MILKCCVITSLYFLKSISYHYYMYSQWSPVVVVFSDCLTKCWQDLNLGRLPLHQTLQKSRLYCAFCEIHHTTAMQLYFGAWSCAWYSSQNIDLIILQAHIANRNPIENYGMQLHVLTVSPQVKFLYNHRMNLIGNTCCQLLLLSLFPMIISQYLSSQEINKCVWFCLFIRWDPSSQACCTYWFNPLTPKISLVILLNVCHMILLMLVWRIWY